MTPSDVFLFFFPGRWISRVSQYSALHVSELRRSSYVRPLRCASALWVQLSRWPLLLLRQSESAQHLYGQKNLNNTKEKVKDQINQTFLTPACSTSADLLFKPRCKIVCDPD